MRTILSISKREITRLRTRFSGRSRLIVLAVVALTIISSYVIYHQDLVISKGLYTVGVTPDGPPVADQRFSVVKVERQAGYDLLRQGAIDLYLDGEEIVSRGDDRSQYAAGALQKSMAKQDLIRISNEYEVDRAFPLRVEVSYLKLLGNDGATETALTDTGALTGREEILSEAQPPAAAGAEEPAVTSMTTPSAAIAEMPGEGSPEQAPSAGSETDDVVRRQLAAFADSNQLPEFKAEFVSENEVIIPSLMQPPVPLAQIIITFLYVVPVFFVSLFFTSGFTEEKINRKLIVLLSAPVTRLQVILGKMLPYFAYSVVIIIAITLALGGDLLLGVAIFVPVMLFIFSIYLMVALTYRTFKDQTFFSVLALSVVTVYLVGPAMFVGVNDLSYISPLTLAVEMYRGESFSVGEYFLAETPLLLIFGQSLFVGTRVLNEEYLMGFKPLPTKVAQALYFIIDRNHLSTSVFFLSLFMVPVVFMVQLSSIALISNLPALFTLWFLVVISVVVEELAKSAGIIILLRHGIVKSWPDILKLSLLSALGFLIGEKLLLYLALSVLSESVFISAIFGSGLLVMPLILHMVTTFLVCLITARLGIRYFPLAVLVGTVIHTMYNLLVIGAVA